MKRQLALLPRKEIAEKAIQNGSAIVMTKDLHEAMQISNRLAPEHLSLQVEAPFDWVPAVENAGSVFVGSWTPEALGDYLAGPNHTLPTAGTARFRRLCRYRIFRRKPRSAILPKRSFGISRSGGTDGNKEVSPPMQTVMARRSSA